MRITRLADIPVVMHIQHDDEIIIALPSHLSKQDILELASLVLSCEEFDDLARTLPADNKESR